MYKKFNTISCVVLLALLGFANPTLACTTPTGIMIMPNSSGASIMWNAVTGATKYYYVIDQSSMDPMTSPPSTTMNAVMASSLNASTNYYFHVMCECSGSTYSSWATQSFTTSPLSLTAPATVMVTPAANSASFTWGAVSGASMGYEFVVDQSSMDPMGAGTSTMTASATKTGLKSYTSYYVHVRANGGSGTYSPWTTKSFTTLINTAVNNVSASEASVTVYPNPATNVLTLDAKGLDYKNATIQVLGMDGRMLSNQQVSNEQTTINVANLAAGVYLLKYTGDGTSQTVRFNKL